MKKTLQECKEIVAAENGYDFYPKDKNLDLAGREIIKITDRANKMYYEQGEWVSVGDELPKEDGEYIVYIVSIIRKTICNVQFFNGEFMSSKVTHWQPLPNSPQK